jgi:hypothetical protein
MVQVSIKYTYQHLPFPPKFIQIWIFGLKTNHLATLQGGLMHLFLSVNHSNNAN